MAEALIFHRQIQSKRAPVDPDDLVRLQDVDATVGSRYEHQQVPLATVWNVHHELDQQIVSVQVVNGNVIMIPEIEFVDDDNVTLTFAQARNGTAIIRR